MPDIVRRKVDFSELRLFWVVAEAGSFGAAARALGVSPSTLTRAVDNLEARLEAKLLVRTAQGVTLTPAGMTAYDRVLTMERSAAALEIELAGHDKAASGTVKVSAPDGVSGVLMAPYIADFVRANPAIDLIIDCGLWPDRPLEGEIDVALTFARPEQIEVVSRPLAWFHYGLFAARSHVDLYGTPGSLHEALGHSYVHHTAQVHQRSSRAKAYQDMAEPRVTTNSSAVSFNAICEGAGIGALPTCVLSVRPDLVMVQRAPQPAVPMWLVQRQETIRSARVRQVVAWLEEVFDQKTQPWYREEYVSPEEFAPDLERHLVRRRGALPRPAEVTPLHAPKRA
ncbi:MAG TPA: LysR family transcriptional regulator [Caulobacteraceae bacterium]|nr:LysR family transcriptional regulator [Caulobacteraceae bacterium]